MNHAVKGFQMSFLLHAVLLSLVFGLSHSIRWDRRPPIVIDFSITDGAVERTADRPSIAGVASSPINSPSKSEITAPKQKPIVHRSVARMADTRPVRPASFSPIEEKVIANEETAPVHEAVNRKQAEADSASGLQPAPAEPLHGSGQAKPGGVHPSGQDSGQDAGQGLPAEDEQRQRYIREHFTYIRDMIMQHLSYPMLARKMGWSGRVVVSFTVLDDGQVEDIKVVKSSGFNVLDANAIKTIEKTAPFPRPPVKAELIIPIVYRLS